MSTSVKWLLGVVVLAVAAFAWWAISPIFIYKTADEALPGAEVPVNAPAATTGRESPEEPMDEPMPSVSQPQVGPTAQVYGTAGHPASGTVRTVKADGQTYVRYENFHTINGPDIFVYLSKDKNASDFVDLGRVKATEGNINYEVPAGVDVSQYPYVLTWCRTFSALFNYAQLN